MPVHEWVTKLLYILQALIVELNYKSISPDRLQGYRAAKMDESDKHLHKIKEALVL